MNQQVKEGLEVLAIIRKKFFTLTETFGLEQLNTIPTGYNNNLIWNIIHCPVSTDLLIYGPCGLPIPLSKWVDAYRKGTRPDPNLPVTIETVEEVREELTASYTRLTEDYQSGIFKGYQTYKTQFGVTLTNAEYAILYAIEHEMFHLGYAMALRRQLGYTNR